MRGSFWMRGSVVLGVLLGSVFLGGCARAAAPDESSSPSDEVRVAPVGGALDIPDEPLLDQDGNEVRLRDWMAGRVVAVNFVYTTCTTICSPMTAILGRVQKHFGERMDREVRLVSISLDPATDTPERLRAYAYKFERGPGWLFLTGPKERVQRMLKALGGYSVIKEEHAPVTLIGRMDEGRWERVYGLAQPARLVDEIETMANSGTSERKP